jgi:hypothetical protein
MICFHKLHNNSSSPKKQATLYKNIIFTPFITKSILESHPINVSKKMYYYKELSSSSKIFKYANKQFPLFSRQPNVNGNEQKKKKKSSQRDFLLCDGPGGRKTRPSNGFITIEFSLRTLLVYEMVLQLRRKK